MWLKFFLIIIYLILIFTTYLLIIKRLKYLTSKHIKITNVEWINNWYITLSRIIFILLAIDAGLSVFLILTLL
jgi:hypothetical protein